MTSLRGLVKERMLLGCFVSVQLIVRRAGGEEFDRN